MDYSFFIWSAATFIEKRVKLDVDYSELENAIGFSYRHIRGVFKNCMNRSLSNYIISRKVANAAFELVHTNRKIIDIAEDYGFDTYDTFTRAFKRETGITPIDFRKGEYLVGRQKIASGAYAPAILKSNNKLIQSEISEEFMKDIVKTTDSCILFGVPKVEYRYEECTPFPSCLKACLNYMGQNIDYTYLMAASGAAFRLRWNTKFWDGGNVDIQYIYENKLEAFERSFKSAGRSCKILERQNAGKSEFISMIKAEIDDGRPVIALGIIGPPEACIITGYADNGETLYGWNFFQHVPEYSTGVEIHETGYFICKNWWENKDTAALMAIGEEQHPLVSQKDIILNAIDIMAKEKLEIQFEKTIQVCAGGQAAYDKWAADVGNDKEFPQNAILPILFERLMCQGDAQVMVGEGRSYAACFIEWVGKSNNLVADECAKAAKYFRETAECAFKMNEPKGGFEQNETTARKFAEPDVRKQIVSLILKAKENEAKACDVLRIIADKL